MRKQTNKTEMGHRVLLFEISHLEYDVFIENGVNCRIKRSKRLPTSKIQILSARNIIGVRIA